MNHSVARRGDRGLVLSKISCTVFGDHANHNARSTYRARKQRNGGKPLRICVASQHTGGSTPVEAASHHNPWHPQQVPLFQQSPFCASNHAHFNRTTRHASRRYLEPSILRIIADLPLYVPISHHHTLLFAFSSKGLLNSISNVGGGHV
jgi:hypothetical protein